MNEIIRRILKKNCKGELQTFLKNSLEFKIWMNIYLILIKYLHQNRFTYPSSNYIGLFPCFFHEPTRKRLSYRPKWPRSAFLVDFHRLRRKWEAFEFHFNVSFLGKRIISSVTCKHGHIANRQIFLKTKFI